LFQVQEWSNQWVLRLLQALPRQRLRQNALQRRRLIQLSQSRQCLISKDNVNIALTLQNLKSSVDALPAVLSKEGPNTQLFNAVNDISDKLKSLIGGEGVDLGGLLDEKLGGSSTIKDMRKKTESISAIVDLLLQIMEAKLGGIDTPIVSTSLTSGSVKFRIMVVNPSKTRVQKVKCEEIPA